MSEKKPPSFSSKSSSDGEDVPFLSDEEQLIVVRRPSLFRRVAANAWIISTVFFFLTTIGLGLQNVRLNRRGTWASGFDTELRPAVGSIELIEYHFTGGLDLNSEGKLARTKEPGVRQYVGQPSPEIDRAWDDLMIASEIVLTGEEAKGWEHLTVPEPDGKGFRLAVDTYHTLHCVNEARKAIDYEYYYGGKEMPYFWREHIDHCLDYVRQVVQCQSDLTPLTYLPDPTINATLPVFGGGHTCRNFNKIHEWAMERKAPQSFEQ